MTVSSTTNRVSFTGNGVTTAFSFPYYIQAQADLKVLKVLIADGTETLQTITTHYTISGTLVNGVYPSGVTVTMVSAPSSSYKLVIYRDPALTQSMDLVENDPLPAETLEQSVDRAILISQRLDERMDRSINLPDGFTATFDPALPSDINTANAVLVVNAAGTGWDVGPTTTEIEDAEAEATAAAASAVLASQWATLTSGQVASTDYSAKAWAIGGTGVTDTASRGAAKEWAIETASSVDTSEYSSKEYAVGTQRRGLASGGSSKDWAVYTGGTVDNAEYSSKYHAQAAAASAVAAQQAVDSIIWNDVVFKTFADSPITLVEADRGKLIVVDCTGGAVAITVPEIATLDLTDPFTLGIKKSDTSVNAITITRSGTDTIDGATTSTISQPNSGRIFIPDTDPSPDTWTTQFFGTADEFLTGVTFSEISTPSTPASGKAKLYPKTDNLFYQLNDGGIERRFATDLLGGMIQNVGAAASVGSNALTVAAKTAAGNDPSATDRVSVAFRSATLTTGRYEIVDLAAALSLVITSGSTLGQISGVEAVQYWYFINSAGAIKIGVSRTPLDENVLHTSVAEGGAGAADSASVLYSDAVYSSCAVRCFLKLYNTQATAGTYATAPSNLAVFPFHDSYEFIGCSYTTDSGQTFADNGTLVFEDRVFDSHNMMNTGTGIATVPKDGRYAVFSKVQITAVVAAVTNTVSIVAQKAGGSTVNKTGMRDVADSTSSCQRSSNLATVFDCVKGDTIKIIAEENIANAMTLTASGSQNFFEIIRVG